MTDTSYGNDSVASLPATDNAGTSASNRLLVESTDQSKSNGILFKQDKGDVSGLGFPSVDFSGFEQEAPYKSTDRFDAIWHGIKHIFLKDENVGEKLRKDIESRMSPQERKQFDEEERTLQKYSDELRNRGMMMTLQSLPPLERPDTPMHDVIQKRLEQAEMEVERSVRAKMSPGERLELDRQLRAYKAAVNEFLNPGDPLSTSIRPMPEPGPAIKDYFKRIAPGAEAYMRTH